MAARTAVVAGTATAVSGRTARRQQQRYAAKDAEAAQQQAVPMEQGAPPAGADDQTAELERLAQLHTQGVLTDEEFAAAKKEALGI